MSLSGVEAKREGELSLPLSLCSGYEGREPEAAAVLCAASCQQLSAVQTAACDKTAAAHTDMTVTEDVWCGNTLELLKEL